MEELKTKASHLKDHVREYVQDYIQLAKAKATKGASDAAASIVIAIATVVFVFFFLFFAAFGLGWWLGSILNNRAAGFFIVAGVFILCTLLLFALRKKVIAPMIRNAVISKVYE